MSKQKQILGVLSLLLLGGCLVAWWKVNRGSPSVALVFVGFTNKTFMLPPTISPHGTPIVPSFTIRVARMLVTNSGAAPVQVRNAARPASLRVQGFVLTHVASASVLKPGESLLIETQGGSFTTGWWTEVPYQRYGFLDRIASAVRGAADPSVRKLVNSLVSAPTMRWVESSWITNQPPPRPSSTHISITMPPRLESIELPPGSLQSDVVTWPSLFPQPLQPSP